MILVTFLLISAILSGTTVAVMCQCITLYVPELQGIMLFLTASQHFFFLKLDISSQVCFSFLEF